MTDLDAGPAAPPPAPTAPMEPGSPLPPPAPGPLPESDDRISKMLALVALVSLGVALITTVLWLGGRNDGASGVEEPAAVEAPADEEQAQLDAAEARVAELEAEVAALTASATTEAGLTSELRQAESDLADTQSELIEVSAELETATATTAELETSLAAAEARLAELESNEGVALDTPEFDRWIGELLSSRSGGSRLGADAASCFGAAVIDQIGLDALGAGQNNAASGQSRQVVIDAMVSAADTCGIDQALIFS